MQESIVALSIPIIALLGSFTVAVFLRKYENDEKMAMIAKGLTPPQKTAREIKPSSYLGLGFVCVGFGIGLLMGSLLESVTNLDGDVAHFSMIFIFGGLGLLASYFYQMSLDKKNKE
jgi:hypothetical protein